MSWRGCRLEGSEYSPGGPWPLRWLLFAIALGEVWEGGGEDGGGMWAFSCFRRRRPGLCWGLRRRLRWGFRWRHRWRLRRWPSTGMLVLVVALGVKPPSLGS